MTLLLRAIITGFGYKIGAELGRLVAEKLGIKKREDKPAEADLPEGLPKSPPTGDDDAPPEPDEPDDGDGEDGDGEDVEDSESGEPDSAEPNAA